LKIGKKLIIETFQQHYFLVDTDRELNPSI